VARPRGRPPAPRGVYSFEDVLVPPHQLVLDTSFVVDALLRTESRHEECRQILERVADARSTIFFNRLLDAELCEAAYKIAVRELHPGGLLRDVRTDRRMLRRGQILRDELEAAWWDALGALDWVAIEVGEVVQWVPEVMAHGLPSYDACHIATALYADVRAVVTLDYGFALMLPRDIDVYVPAARVRAMRQRRARRT
jgi:predicted nucleic acid-binding protein